MAIKINGGRVIDPANQLDKIADVYVHDGKIAAIGRPQEPLTIDQDIDAQGQIVCPGFIDLSARLREPGAEHTATIASETAAAAGAGITTLCCPPDTQPVIDTPAVVELIHQRAEQASKAKIVCLGALSHDLKGERLAEMYALKTIGCVGVSNAQVPIKDTGVMLCAMEYAATCGLTVFLYAQDPWLGRQGHMHAGGFSTRLGIPAIPETAETVSVNRDLLLIEQTGARAHFGRLSSARAVAMIAEAQARDLPVTADVGVHYLHLTNVAVGHFNSLCHVHPPFRSQHDLQGLRVGLASGAVTAVCSDHQPHDVDAKLAPFSMTEPGISGLEALLPLMLRLVDEDIISLSTAIAALTSQPAKVLGLAAGTLNKGACADICIFNPNETWILTKDTIRSHGKNSPLLGHEMKGVVTHTLLDGKLIFQKSETS